MCVCVCLFLLQRTDVSVAHVSITVLVLSLRPDTHAHVLVATRARLVKKVSRAYVFYKNESKNTSRTTSSHIECKI